MPEDSLNLRILPDQYRIAYILKNNHSMIMKTLPRQNTTGVFYLLLQDTPLLQGAFLYFHLPGKVILSIKSP